MQHHTSSLHNHTSPTHLYDPTPCHYTYKAGRSAGNLLTSIRRKHNNRSLPQPFPPHLQPHDYYPDDLSNNNDTYYHSE